LSPAKRLEQLFSLTALGRLLKSLLPVAAVVWLTTALLTRDWTAVLTLPHLAVDRLVRLSADRVFEIAWKSALVLVLWSGADYLLERHGLESQLRMSRQDLADEFKETEGQPAVKARIRRLQRQLRRRRMLEQVKRATVVITNPTEFAVALEYGPAMAAPVVLAKGRNLIARQIKDLARWSGIPLVENPPLAHALRAVCGSDCDPVHRGQPRRGAHRRSYGPLYPRCPARQTDGD
jgi:flagellar biosynthetic protein FlhB